MIKYTTALNFFVGEEEKEETKQEDIIYILTNFKRKGTSKTLSLFKKKDFATLVKTVPFDIEMVQLIPRSFIGYADLLRLVSGAEKDAPSSPIQKKNVLFFESMFEASSFRPATKATFLENLFSDPAFKTLKEVQAMEEKPETLIFEANPYMTTAEEYKLAHISCKTNLIIIKDQGRKEWIVGLFST